VSSGIYAKVLALENRQDEFKKFRVDMLACTNRTTTTVEALQKTLMCFLQQGNTVFSTGMAPLTTECTQSPSHPTKVRENKSNSDPYALDDTIRNMDCEGGQQKAAVDEGKPNIVLEEDNNVVMEENVHDNVVVVEKVHDNAAVVEEKVHDNAVVVEEKVHDNAAIVEEKVHDNVVVVVEDNNAVMKDNNIVILEEEDNVVVEEKEIDIPDSLEE